MGMNHKTAPVALRECLAFTSEDTAESLAVLKENPAIHEVLIVSTCNRVEILLVTTEKETALSSAKQHISAVKRIAAEDYEKALYVYTGEEAVRHIFRVAASLDSLVLGEPQILGQIKEAYRLATVKKTSGVLLNRLLHRTFFVAKKIRTETGIGDSAVSVSYAAIELARKIFGSLEGKRALLIGAGEMAEIAVEHLIRNRSGKIFVANRTFSRGMELADRFNGQAIRIEEITETLKEVDIIISSTGATGYMVTREQVKGTMRSRRNRPIFFIDIAVPRDIEPAVNRINNAYVYDIDDLMGIVDENLDERRKEAVRGERIVDEAVLKFQEWLNSLDVVPTIVDMKNKFEVMAEEELQKTFHSLQNLSDQDRQALHRMMDALIKKILHNPTLFLKGDGCSGDRSGYIDMARKLFDLD